MKSNWISKKLGDVCSVIAGQSPEGKYYNKIGSGLPFYQGKKEFSVKYIGEPTTWTTSITKEALPGDILISVRAPVGPVNFTKQKICIGRGLAAIRPSTHLDKEYLFYYLLMNENALEQNMGAVFGSINKNQIENIKIPCPSIQDQKFIVSILDKAFATIDKAKVNAERNLKNSRVIFECYLRDLFKNKLDGTCYETLDSLCEIIVDCEHKTAPTQDTGYPLIRTPNIGKGDLLLDNVYRVSEETYNAWTKRAAPESGDLILAREAPAGNIAVIPPNIKVCLGQRTVLIRPKKHRLGSSFLSYLILSKDVQAQLLSHSTGSTVEHINMKDIRAFKIYNLTSLIEQKTIVHKLDALSAETKKLESLYSKKISKLNELKKSILQKAFTGELTKEEVPA